MRDEQSRRDIREEFDLNILVEAGAGSGKTQMLAERMAAGVRAGVYQVEHMAAVTFTRKAASELRGRFHLALEDELTGRAARRGPRARIDAAGAVQPGALLRRHHPLVLRAPAARAAGRVRRVRPASPNWTKCRTSSSAGAASGASSWRSAQSRGDPTCWRCSTRTSARTTSTSVRHHLRQRGRGVPARGGVPCPDPKAWKALRRSGRTLQKELPAASTRKPRARFSRPRGVQAQAPCVRGRVDRPPWSPNCCTTGTASPNRPEVVGRPRARRSECGADPARCTTTSARRGDAVPRAVAPVRLPPVDALLTRARERARPERRRLNALNYGDLLNLTARCCARTSTCGGRCSRSYAYCSSTSSRTPTRSRRRSCSCWRRTASAAPPRRGAKASGQTPPNWRTVPLRPGALFVVGDPKQSIYRFRRADIDIYNIVRERFSEPASAACCR